MSAARLPVGTVADNAPDHDLMKAYAYLIREDVRWRANLSGYDRAGVRRRTSPPVVTMIPATRISGTPVPDVSYNRAKIETVLTER